MHNSDRDHFGVLSSCELLVGHAEGVEHDYTIILMIGARLGLLNGRVECQMVDLRAVFGRSLYAKFRFGLAFDRVRRAHRVDGQRSRLIRSGARHPIQ